jgi:predicted N-acetyltransferase YhbS
MRACAIKQRGSQEYPELPRGGDMTVVVRKCELSDVPAAADICYRAFKTVAERHGFPPDIPNPQMANTVLSIMTGHPHFYSVVAEIANKVAGSNFLDERNPISGIGPITVDPEVQNDGIGSALMDAVLRRSNERGFAGARLVQAGYHSRSLALYSKLGFNVREQLACLQGKAIGGALPGYSVRAATSQDMAACNQLCVRVHGHDRAGELLDAVTHGSARVVERLGRITGYATSIAFFSHAVADSNDDLRALIAAAESFGGPGFLLPTRNGEIMRWCLAHGLRITQTMTLMTIGLYNEPVGAWLPSVSY